ncbi:MAG: primosomal protein DnaI [Bacilli bacterium]|nr:primosomal protein DnaI [Bacilli bacterium]
MKKVMDSVKTSGVLKKELPSLKTEYNKALKDADFKELVFNISLPEKELMKYTSKLEDSVKEIKNCSNCKNLLECKNNVEGFVYMPQVKNNILTFSYVACKYKKRNLKEYAFQNNVYMIELPKEIKEASMKNIYTEDKNRFDVIKWLKGYIDKYSDQTRSKGLYLHGNFGCGKTYLIAALFNELAKKDVKSAIIYWPEFLRSLKSSFNDDFGEKFDYIKKVPLLLIDDIGAENTTPWGRDEILGPILQYRMQEQLPTFFTSNLNLKDLENHFSLAGNTLDKVKGRRIIERIKQLTEEKEMISKNRRQ